MEYLDVTLKLSFSIDQRKIFLEFSLAIRTANGVGSPFRKRIL